MKRFIIRTRSLQKGGYTIMNRFVMVLLLTLLTLGMITSTIGAQTSSWIEARTQGPSLILGDIPISQQPLSENSVEPKYPFGAIGATLTFVGVLLGLAEILGFFDTKKIFTKRRTS